MSRRSRPLSATISIAETTQAKQRFAPNLRVAVVGARGKGSSERGRVEVG